MNLTRPKISIVSPVYRAEALVNELVQRILISVSALTEDFEIILVDDRSPDNSWQQILRNTALDKRVRGIRLSRNFGQHKAITAGLAECRGEWVVVMDCDLQDQPEEISKLFACAQQGYDIVFARRAERQDTAFKRFFSSFFYWILSYLTETKQDPAIANFGIYRYKVISAVLNMKDNIRYFPTMVRWVGFAVASVPVEHAERSIGKSSYSFRKLMHLALDIILSYSDKPLRMVVKLGLIVSLLSFAMAVTMVVRFLTGDVKVIGYTSLIISIWLLSGLLMVVLGMVGLYIGRTFDQVKNRPMYLVDEVIN